SALLVRLSPNNQDFVFRRNEVVGGSAGVFNNSTRALIADNVFRNTRGPAVRAGVRHHHSLLPASGCGARDYVIRDNDMENCGATAIGVTSDAGIGGNIIIKNNRIRYPNSPFWYAISVIGNNDGVVVKDNLFQSPKPPARGPWIRSLGNEHPVRHSNNRIDPPHADVPMLREFLDQRSKVKAKK
ncbi:MAG: right-handed parallel beta-helix repeat-containing protein, partial [Planctomycetota bacterium]|nr:right-handed parallel beta-helix repeat-containing protein [Planctomycetota bacterium]